MKSFKLFCEQAATSIGLFPGAFKPPHKGHFETVKKAARENSEVFVLISAIDRDGISASQSASIWNLYKPYLPKNISYITVTGSPVTMIYQTIDIVNNGQFTPTARTRSPLPDALNVASIIQNNKLPVDVILYASKEDANRFNAFFDMEKSKIYRGKNVKSIKIGKVSRIASATQARQALKEDNYEAFKAFLPEITKEDKQRIYSLLKP